MADWFGLQVLLLLLLLLSVLLLVLLPGVRSYLLSCGMRRRRRKSLTETDPGQRVGKICSSTPLGRVRRCSRSDLEKIFIQRLGRLDNSHHAVDLDFEQTFQDLEEQYQYSLGDETLHNLFCQPPDISRSFSVEETKEGCEVMTEEMLEKFFQDQTISDSMVNITFVC